MRSRRPLAPTLVYLTALAATLGALGCRSRGAPAGTGAVAAGQPTITLEPAAYTYERGNRNQWLMVKATFANRTAKPITVRWDALQARADGKLAGPTWQRNDLRRELDPGDEVQSVVSWYRLDASKPRPTEIVVTYPDAKGRPLFERKLPVKVIGTSGFAFRLSLPATAVLVANEPPQRGQSWEVRVAVEIRNPSKAPLMLVPFWFEATSDDQKVPHSGKEPALLNAITRLDPGELVRGALLWRFRGTGPRPKKLRVTFPSGGQPEFAETIPVTAPER
jgi:hypothetical protein